MGLSPALTSACMVLGGLVGSQYAFPLSHTWLSDLPSDSTIFIVPPFSAMMTQGCSCRCMVSGALGITTDFQTLTSSFSNCGNRCVCVAPFCERTTPTAAKTKTMMTTRLTENIFIVASRHHLQCV